MAGTLVIDTLKSSTTGPTVFQNTSGVETGQLCRAWVNFNGTGTVAIRAAFNVSSITDNGVGDYTVNFTNAMADANYVANVTASIENSGASTSIFGNVRQVSTTLAGSVRINLASSGVQLDPTMVNVAIFR